MFQVNIVIGILLVALPYVPYAVFDTRILPRTFATYWSGVTLVFLGLAFAVWARRHIGSNWSGTVTVKENHASVRTGPYAWVRHPMYSGIILLLVGSSLLLGSWWGVAISPLFAVLLAVRAGIEERALIAGLPDYAGYAARVRYRLAPGLW